MRETFDHLKLPGSLTYRVVIIRKDITEVHSVTEQLEFDFENLEDR